MRRSGDICLACRVRLATVTTALTGGSSVLGPWHRNPAARTRAFSTASEPSTENHSAERGPAQSTTTPISRRAAAQLQTQLPTPPQTHPRRRRRPRQQLDDGALAIFRDVIEKQQDKGRQRGRENGQNGQNGQNEPAPALGGRSLGASAELYQHLVKLAQLRSQPDVSIGELYAFFEANMYPLMVDETRGLTNIFRQSTQQLVRDVSAAKQADYGAAHLPSVARLTQIRRQLDLLNKPQSWLVLVMGQIEAILHEARKTLPNSLPDSDSPDTETRAFLSAQLDDLVQTWRMFSLPDIVVADPEALAASPPGEFRLPTPDRELLAAYGRQRNILLTMATLFPRYSPDQLRAVAPAVIATYALLTDPDVVGRTPAVAGVAGVAAEFLQAVAHVLSIASFSRMTIAGLFRTRPVLRDYVMDRWPLVEMDQSQSQSQIQAATGREQRGMRMHNSRRSSSSPSRSPSSFPASLDNIHNQLSQALRSRNLEACEAVWNVFWSSVTVPDTEGVDRLRESAEIFDFFIMVFTTMRKPDRAIAVWNLMTMAGVQPTLRTWTSFMEGCKLASNAIGIRNIWDKLMASGLPADTVVWTARISGLIQAGEVEAGIQALEEMQQTWEAAQREEAETGEAGEAGEAEKAGEKKKKRHPAVKPTIEPVNAAIAGLLRQGDLATARQILAWAGQHGISPNIITFNTILRPLVREGRGEEVAGLLNIMAQLGIQPDEATVTVLLGGALGGGGGEGSSVQVSEAEQVEIVKRMLASIEAAGIDANQQTYAKMIHMLLQQQQQNHHHQSNQPAPQRSNAAVDVVLSRMAHRGMVPSAYICTILAEHYFSCDPPDLDAVRHLIETGQPRQWTDTPSSHSSSSSSHSSSSPPRKPTPPHFDRVFWERIVRGFAQVGDATSALHYFSHIADSVSVTTFTLEDLLRALIRASDWDAAAHLVAKVQAQKMELIQSGEPERVYEARLFRHRFWHLAAEHGLLQPVNQ